VPGRTIHHRMSEHLTFSFSHLFELAHELSISLDQGGGHSQNDRAGGHDSLFDHAALERTSPDRHPVSIDLLTQCARERDPGFQGAFLHRESASPAPDAIGAPRSLDRGFDEGPAQPG
jgi:hypothetical protein